MTVETTYTKAAIDSLLAGKANTTGLDGSGMTDGQLIAWSTSLGRFTPVNPTGQAEVAYAENVSSAVTSASSSSGVGTAVAIPGVAISVAPSGGRPITLDIQANIQQTVVGTGSLFLSLVETTGTATTVFSAMMPLPNSATAPLCYFTLSGKLRIGTVSSTRTFALKLLVWQATGSPAVNSLNAPDNPSFLRAMAG